MHKTPQKLNIQIGIKWPSNEYAYQQATKNRLNNKSISKGWVIIFREINDGVFDNFRPFMVG